MGITGEDREDQRTAGDSGRTTLATAIAALSAIVAMASCGPQAKQRGAFPTKKRVASIGVAYVAEGATRMLRSPSGEYLLAELAGRWRMEAFPWDAAAVPPVFKLIHERSGRVIARGNGWVVGPPTDTGDVVYIEEHGEEYRYRLRSLTRPTLMKELPTPEGAFHVVGNAVRVGEFLVAMLYLGGDSKEPDWLVSIDPDSLSIVASAKTASARLGDAGATKDALLLLELPREGDAWSVVGIDPKTLRTRWRTPLAGTKGTVFGGTFNSKAYASMSGDGRHLAVAYGEDVVGGLDAKTVYVVDTIDGSVVRTLPAPDRLFGVVDIVAPASGLNAIVFTYNLHTKKDGDRFSGLLILGLEDGRVLDEFEVSRAALGEDWEQIYRLGPLSLLCNSALDVVLAPRADHFGGGGFNASSVQGLVRTPPDWHQRDRPQVKARAAALGQTLNP